MCRIHYFYTDLWSAATSWAVQTSSLQFKATCSFYAAHFEKKRGLLCKTDNFICLFVLEKALETDSDRGLHVFYFYARPYIKQYVVQMYCTNRNLPWLNEVHSIKLTANNCWLILTAGTVAESLMLHVHLMRGRIVTAAEFCSKNIIEWLRDAGLQGGALVSTVAPQHRGLVSTPVDAQLSLWSSHASPRVTVQRSCS